MSPRPIRVLVVDDSSVMRMLLTRLLRASEGIDVVGCAVDAYDAREKLVQLRPDVMTLDLDMPRMDGLTFLEKVMAHLPTRTIVISATGAAGSGPALRALELGAIDVVQKPKLEGNGSLEAMQGDLVERVKAAARARIQAASRPSAVASVSESAVDKRPKPIVASRRSGKAILAIASSTGGTEALKVVLKGLAPDPPPTLIVQHMPPMFTKAYAEQLSRILPFPVLEARDGDVVLPGQALLAPGNCHMVIERSGSRFVVKLNQGPLLHGVRPAADHLMHSVARWVGAEALGVVLTGMGRDGADGLLAMRRTGSFTVAQDEATCVVYGMPKMAVEAGAVERVAPLDEIAGLLVRRLQRCA